MTKKQKIILWISIIVITIGLAFIIYISFKKGKSLRSSKVAPSSSTNFLFIGDSLTAYNNSFADQLKLKYPNINIKKIAKVGEKTSWMLSELRNELASGRKYDVITIFGGVNDIYALGSINATKQNLQQMFDISRNTGAKVVALTIIPTSTYNKSTPKTTQLTSELNQWINSNNSINAIVDVNNILNDGNNGTKPQYLQPDTLHITNAGHSQIMADFNNKVIS